MEHNPILRHMLGKNVRRGAWLTVVLAVDGLAVMLLVGLLLLMDGWYELLIDLALPMVMTALLLPPLMAVVAARTTASYVQTDAFQMVQITDLPARQIVEACLGVALYRLRLLLVVAFALMPLCFLAIILLELEFAAGLYCCTLSMQAPFNNQPSYLEMVYLGDLALSYALLALGYWGWVGAAGAIGVWIGMRSRRPAAASGYAFLASLLVLMIGGGVLLAGVSPWLRVSTGWLYLYEGVRLKPEFLPAMIVEQLVPWAAMVGILALARRSVRRDPATLLVHRR